jgi:hypothetical protein
MIEKFTDIWSHLNDGRNHVFCVSTNGFLKMNGECVMGRGCAKEAARMWPNAPKLLGEHILKNGNVPGILDVNFTQCLITLPVKHNWWEDADVELIKKSIEWLKEVATAQPKLIFHVPRLGCGYGHLAWETVKPLMEALPDNVWVHSK